MLDDGLEQFVRQSALLGFFAGGLIEGKREGSRPVALGQSRTEQLAALHARQTRIALAFFRGGIRAGFGFAALASLYVSVKYGLGRYVGMDERTRPIVAGGLIGGSSWTFVAPTGHRLVYLARGAVAGSLLGSAISLLHVLARE